VPLKPSHRRFPQIQPKQSAGKLLPPSTFPRRLRPVAGDADIRRGTHAKQKLSHVNAHRFWRVCEPTSPEAQKANGRTVADTLFAAPPASGSRRHGRIRLLEASQLELVLSGRYFGLDLKKPLYEIENRYHRAAAVRPSSVS
jgi:hypothetical protein